MYLGLFLTIVLGIFWISFKRPEALVALTICMFGVESFFAAKDTFFLYNSWFANATILMALSVRSGYQFLKLGGGYAPMRNATWRIVAVLLGYALLSGAWTPEFNQFKTNWTRGAPYIVAYLLLLPLLFRSHEIARQSLIWILGIGSTVALMLYLYCDWEHRGVVVAGQSGVGQRDTSAILAIAQLGGTIALIAALIRVKNSRIMFLGRWVLVALGLLLVFKTGSRGQAIFAIGCIPVFVLLNNNKISFRNFIVSLFSLVLFGYLTLYLFENFATHGRWGSTFRSLSERQDMWNGMFEIWRRQGPAAWIFGMGSAACYKYIGFYIHNVPLEMLIECGLIGAATYMMIWIETGKNLHKGMSNTQVLTLERYNVLIVYTALFTFECLNTLKSGSLFGQQLFLFYAITVEETMRRGGRRAPIRQFPQRGKS